MTLLVVYLFTALLFSFLCSLMESVLLTTPQTFLKVNSNSNKLGLNKLSYFRVNVDQALSAILSLNTIAHTVGAAGVGAQASVVFGDAYFGIVSAVLTLLILVFTEIIPKTLGTKYWRNLASFIGHAIQITVFIMYPLVFLSGLITKLISKSHSPHTTSREEISALAEIGLEEGIFQENENKIIQNLIKLKSIKISEIMTPRTVITSANEAMTLTDFHKNKEFLRFSRIPIYSDNQDNITGYIFRQMVFEKLAEDMDLLSLRDIKKSIIYMPNTIPVYKAWEQMLEKKEHIAAVVDEYGGLDGIITMEDIIETLLGFEIVDEKDTIVDMQQFARDRWLKRQMKYDHLQNS